MEWIMPPLIVAIIFGTIYKLTELFEAVSGKEDVWYATNMEICEYVTDFRRLIQSADGTFVYNPTLRELFGGVKPGRKNECIPFSVLPGETLFFKDIL